MLGIRRFRFIGIILISILFTTKCTNPANVAAVINLASSVVRMIDTFAELSGSFTERIDKVTGIATSNLNSGRNVGEVADFWESQWKDIHDRYNQLSISLQELNTGTTTYFRELDNNNNMIVDESAKRIDLNKNRNLKNKWQKEYAIAVKSLADTKSILQDGDDFMYILKNATLRQIVTQELVNLKDISVQANYIKDDIKSFERNAKALFKI